MRVGAGGEGETQQGWTGPTYYWWDPRAPRGQGGRLGQRDLEAAVVSEDGAT